MQVYQSKLCCAYPSTDIPVDVGLPPLINILLGLWMQLLLEEGNLMVSSTHGAVCRLPLVARYLWRWVIQVVSSCMQYAALNTFWWFRLKKRCGLFSWFSQCFFYKSVSIERICKHCFTQRHDNWHDYFKFLTSMRFCNVTMTSYVKHDVTSWKYSS